MTRWKLIPVEPTEAMIEAAFAQDEWKDNASGAEHWPSMLAASPSPADDAELVEEVRVHYAKRHNCHASYDNHGCMNMICGCEAEAKSILTLLSVRGEGK